MTSRERDDMTALHEPIALPPRAAWHPPAISTGYMSTTLRGPTRPLVRLPDAEALLHGPTFGHAMPGPDDHDLLSNHAHTGAPIGERMRLRGRVMDEDGRPMANTLVEMWQANAGGRYRHVRDGYLAPLDPNFGGGGRTMTDATGAYEFLTVRPGAYPFPNGAQSWRPAHIHFSLFGHAFAQRLVTQMYFEGDPMIARCPIASTISDPRAIAQLTARLDYAAARPHDMLAWRFDIVLRRTPFEDGKGWR